MELLEMDGRDRTHVKLAQLKKYFHQIANELQDRKKIVNLGEKIYLALS